MRASGVLLPLFSLPSPYGVGSLGQGAYDFVDFLAAARQRYWQMLPIGPTSYGDSPYQSFSTFAGNPYFIDLDLLAAQGLLTQEELESALQPQAERYVDYARLFEARFGVLRRAFGRFAEGPRPSRYQDFMEQNAHWLPDYALYMALKAENGYASWLQWPQGLKSRQQEALEAARLRLGEDIAFHCFLQYAFAEQFTALKAYANQKKVRLIGDIPIYVALDSADTWVHPSLFLLDETLTPTFVAGCPPDYFSKTGQLWGNPLYDWAAHQKEDFSWWTARVKATFRFFDVVRVDHFRGFASFYAIPWGDETAQFGSWREGCGKELFAALKRKLGPLRIIAEDLGYLTPDVFALLKATGFPGMKVLQFAFDPYGNSAYLPHRYPKKCVAYTGTHDNATVEEWMQTARPKERAFAKKYLALTKKEGAGMGFIRGAWASVADTAIAPLQDFLELGKEARVNVPSTLGNNWRWRLGPGDLTPELAEKMAEITRRYGRDSF